MPLNMSKLGLNTILFNSNCYGVVFIYVYMYIFFNAFFLSTCMLEKDVKESHLHLPNFLSISDCCSDSDVVGKVDGVTQENVSYLVYYEMNKFR